MLSHVKCFPLRFKRFFRRKFPSPLYPLPFLLEIKTLRAVYLWILQICMYLYVFNLKTQNYLVSALSTSVYVKPFLKCLSSVALSWMCRNLFKLSMMWQVRWFPVFFYYRQWCCESPFITSYTYCHLFVQVFLWGRLLKLEWQDQRAFAFFMLVPS